MYTIDDYLEKQWEKYNFECVPTQIEPDSIYHSGLTNCDYCNNDTCEFWFEYNT